MTNLMILMTGIKDEQHLPKCTSKTLIYKRPRRPNNKIKKAKPKKPWMSNNCLLN